MQKACLGHCASLHYEECKARDNLEGYSGNLDGFIALVESKWGWTVTVDKGKNRIIVNENKDFCCCPLAKDADGEIPDTLCECSCAFIGKIFSLILQREVNAAVARSYLRDGKSCIYEVEL